MPPDQRLIGYIRVSRAEQNLDLQRDAMKAAGCHEVFQDRISGTRWGRKGLDAALASLRPGDKLAVWRIDRLGRSIVPILTIVEQLEAKGSAVVSLTEGCDTSTDNGKIQCIFLAVVAQMEHHAIKRRTKAGVDAARTRGRRRGAPRKMDARQASEARAMMKSGSSAATTARRYGVGRATLFRHVRQENAA